ncbi:MAG: hypothetical protein ACI8U3_001263 [Brevundimonas sp.]|jgi:hypothetical protein|uniref:DUF1648 domain-containing protein n=1 Tax=Brevundimonas sp. TaxID=1871086 RepID=UPI0039E4AF10
MLKSVAAPAAITIMILIVISMVALLKLPAGASIPMQWNLQGGVNWSAPKAVGVWFTPAIALLVLGTFAYASSQSEAIATRMWPVAYTIGFVLILVHSAHLWFASKHLG